MYIYKPTSKRQRRKTAHSQKKSNEKTVKDKSPRTTVNDENASNKEILKPTEISFVNNCKRKMINDCDHKCPKAVGFSYPGDVLHCSECESEKKKRKYDLKQECMDEFKSVEAIREVERKLCLTPYDKLSGKLMEVVIENFTGCQINKPY